jgi:hypothetical protein
VTEELTESIKQRLDEVGLSLSWLDASFASRIVFAGIMVIYSAFILGWGSHVLGAAIVILPVPLLLLSTYFVARHHRLRSWPTEPSACRRCDDPACVVPGISIIRSCIHPSWSGSGAVRGLVAVAWICATRSRRRLEAHDDSSYAGELPAREKIADLMPPVIASGGPPGFATGALGLRLPPGARILRFRLRHRHVGGRAARAGL